MTKLLAIALAVLALALAGPALAQGKKIDDSKIMDGPDFSGLPAVNLPDATVRKNDWPSLSELSKLDPKLARKIEEKLGRTPSLRDRYVYLTKQVNKLDRRIDVAERNYKQGRSDKTKVETNIKIRSLLIPIIRDHAYWYMKFLQEKDESEKKDYESSLYKKFGKYSKKYEAFRTERRRRFGLHKEEGKTEPEKKTAEDKPKKSEKPERPEKRKPREVSRCEGAPGEENRVAAGATIDRFDLSGAWTATYNWANTGSVGGMEVCLGQEGNAVSGSYTWDGGNKRGTLYKGTLDGDRLDYEYSSPDCSGTGHFILAPDGTSMSGRYFCGDGTGEWKLTRTDQACDPEPGNCRSNPTGEACLEGAPKIKLILDYSNDFHADLQPGAPATAYPDDLSVSVLYIENQDGSFEKIGTLRDATPYKAVQVQENPPLWRVDENAESQSRNEDLTKGWTRHTFDITKYVETAGTYHFRWQWVSGRDTGHVRNFHIEANGRCWYDRDRGAEEGNAKDGNGPALDGGEFVDHYVNVEALTKTGTNASSSCEQFEAKTLRPDLKGVEIVEADSLEPFDEDEIAIGRSFRVRLTYAAEPDAEITETVTIGTVGGVAREIEVTGTGRVIVSSPILVTPADAAPGPVEP